MDLIVKISRYQLPLSPAVSMGPGGNTGDPLSSEPPLLWPGKLHLTPDAGRSVEGPLRRDRPGTGPLLVEPLVDRARDRPEAVEAAVCGIVRGGDFDL